MIFIRERREGAADLAKRRAKRRDKAQDWKIWVGKVDGEYGDFFVDVKAITADSLRDEDDFLFYKIKQFIDRPLNGDAKSFFLQYRLPAEDFPVKIELSSSSDQIYAFNKFAKVPLKQYLDLKLVLRCRNESWVAVAEMERAKQEFAEEDVRKKMAANRIQGRAQLTNFLAKQYLKGQITASTLDDLMHLSTAQLGREVYARLAPDVQRSNQQLIEKRKGREPTPEELWKSGSLTLEEYAARKYPEIGEKLTKVTYPIPAEPEKCIVCHQESRSSLPCPECNHFVCPGCVSTGLNLIVLHPIYCLKLGTPGPMVAQK